MVRGKLLIVASAILFLVASVASAYTPGVPTGLAGAPGEDTCANCHDNLNNGPGSATITAPSQYSAGETIEVTVDVSHVGQEKWGFTLTALDDSNNPVGDFVVTDAERTQLDIDGGNGRQYMMHTEPGTDTGVLDSSPGWTFQWVAPAARPAVTFYLAALAANDAQGTNGDYTYTATHTSSQLETGLAEPDVTTWGRMKSLYR